MDDVFVILIQDTHSDTDAEVWKDEEAAKTRARALAKKYARDQGDISERKVADWVLHITYSCEGDSITVLKKKIL